MRSRTGVLATFAAVLAAGALAGCGSASSEHASVTNLARAADLSSSVSGYRTVMSIRESVPGLPKPIVLTGSGGFSTKRRDGSISMAMNLPEAPPGLANVHLQVVLVRTTMYMKLPAALASRVPGGKPWWKLDLSKASKVAGITGLTGVMNSTSQLNDPGQYLSFLRATSNGSVKSLGSQSLYGVKTTHYRALIDTSKLANVVPASARAAARQLVNSLRQRTGLATSLPIDVWIDSAKLVRQLKMTYSLNLPNTGKSATVAMTIGFPRYGPQPAPQVPPAGQVTDLLSLIPHA